MLTISDESREMARQVRIRIAVSGCAVVFMIGLAIISGTWASWALVAMQIGICWVMIPERG
jgi:hypothetical protein